MNRLRRGGGWVNVLRRERRIERLRNRDQIVISATLPLMVSNRLSDERVKRAVQRAVVLGNGKDTF
jgi:hypothetical protein